ALSATTASALSGQGVGATVGADRASSRTAATVTSARVSGIVQDPAGRPLAGAQVRFLALDGSTREAEADSLGRFAFGDPSAMPGDRVLARRVGFTPDTVPVPPGASSSLLLVLGRMASALPPVVVNGRRDLRGPLAGFYARRAQGQGRFFAAEEIDRQGVRRLSDLLRGLPGLRMDTRRGGMNTMRLRGANVAPLVWLDGAPLGAGELDIDAFDARTFAGVEVYSGPATVPAQFAGSARMTTSGGTIVLWSREGQVSAPRRRRGDPSPFARTAGLVERGEVYTADQVDTAARLSGAEGLAPLYPDSLHAAGVLGAAEVEFVLDAAGRVRPETVGVVWATHPAFGEAVRRAVVAREWAPARRNGMPVPQRVSQTVLFDPQEAMLRP
ncbi:MAG: TonB-dependent receptor plug domain-containing protein, partial [Gemmatimonadota bacterium]|nr:TonB-dependent receptor plug domain-containing protein [Gemmatimonadota bacterium]